MLKFIKQVVRELPKVAVVTNKNYVGALNFCQIVYIGKDERYYKLELFYNETDVFTPKSTTMLLGEGHSETVKDRIISSISSYDTFSKCKAEMVDKMSTQKINKFLERYMNRILDEINSIQVPNIMIEECKLYFTPACMVFIKYRLDGERRPTIKAFIGTPIEVSRDMDVAETYLVEDINEIVSGGIGWF